MPEFGEHCLDAEIGKAVGESGRSEGSRRILHLAVKPPNGIEVQYADQGILCYAKSESI